MPEQAGQIAEGQGQKGKAERGDAKIRRLGQVKREDDEGREVEDQQRESQGRAELLLRAPGELASEKESRPDRADGEQKEQKYEAAPHAIARGRSSGGLEIPATPGADKRDFPSTSPRTRSKGSRTVGMGANSLA